MAVNFQAKRAAKGKDDEGKKRVTVGAVADKSPRLAKTQAAIPDDQRVLILPTSKFYVDEQVRRDIDPVEIQARAASFREQGQLQPISVHPADKDGNHLIIMGECRWRAAQLIKGFKLKAVIDPEAVQWDELKRISVQISENDQRSPLTIMDMAAAISKLAGAKTHEEIATELGWVSKGTGKPNVSKVNRYLGVLNLPEEGQALAKDKVIGDLLTLDCLRKIHKVNPAKFSVLCDLAREDGLSRQRAEQELKQCKANAATGDSEPLPEKPQSSALEPSQQFSITEGEGGALDAAGGERGAQDGESAPDAKKVGEAKPKQVAAAQKMTPGAKVHVEVDGKGSAHLCLLESPQDEGFAWVVLESGERLHVAVNELQITRVIC